MAKTSTDRMREMRDREDYCDEESMITINRGFAIRLANLLKGFPEADQLEMLIAGNKNIIKINSTDTEDSPTFN